MMLKSYGFTAAKLGALPAIGSAQQKRYLSALPIPKTNEEVMHIVFFSMPNKADVQKTMDFYKTVAQKAKRDDKPYILAAQCGTTIQHEPIRDGGYNLISVLQFKYDNDRFYFVKKDPAHLELKAMITGKMDQTQMVLDFISGQ